MIVRVRISYPVPLHNIAKGKIMKDAFKQELAVGDTFVHVTKQSTSCHLKYGIIRSIEDHKIAVTMVVYNYSWEARGYIMRRYNKTINTARNLLKADVPEAIKQQFES